MIEYLIESTFCLAVFYLLFEAVFKRSRNYKINRILLLFFVFFSLTVPLLNIPTSSVAIQKVTSGNHLIMSVVEGSGEMNKEVLATSDSSDVWSLSFLLSTIYFIGVMLLCLRFIKNIFGLAYKVVKADKTNYLGTGVVLFEEEIGPFTFFNSICISKRDFQENKIERALLLHEFAHKKQLHSMDVVLLEFLQLFFWFNPFIYLFKRLIKINHEYLADEFVLKSGANRKEYANKLLHYTFPNKISGFASGFNHVLIKQRIIMLSQFQHKKPLAYRFLLIIPIVSILFLTTAFTGAILPEAETNQVGDGLDAPGILYANTIFWSSEDSKVYLKGNNVKVIHGDNNFKINGQCSYLGKVDHLVVNGNSISKDSPVNLGGKKCKVVKLGEQASRKKYGSREGNGAVEINVVE